MSPWKHTVRMLANTSTGSIARGFALITVLIGAVALMCSSVLVAPLRATAAAIDPETGTRHVTYERDALVSIRTKVRYTTIVVLPEQEEILDWICGDRDNWVISGAKNVTYLKPAEAGARTNLHLVTASGHVYSFVVAEVSNTKAEPDLRVAVDPADAAFAEAAPAPRYYSAVHMGECRDEVTRAQTDAKQATDKADEAIAAFRAAYPGQLRFPYVFARDKKPFFVEAIFHDGRFTYLRLLAPEAPALYEMQDGAPQLIQFGYRDGLVVVPKVLDRGYLVLGRQRLPFSRAEGR
jgi:type IV secretory pathway VirB9-like protein